MAAMDNNDIEQLVNLEQTLFDEGFKDGYAHGEIHGKIEGRALGREKGFELWEELGFYEGFAIFWKAVKVNEENPNARTLNHIEQLLALISKFPTYNPSPNDDGKKADEDEEIDMSKLLSQIRSRYRTLCATLGVKPRSTVSPNLHSSNAPTLPSSSPNNVWSIANGETAPSPYSMSY